MSPFTCARGNTATVHISITIGESKHYLKKTYRNCLAKKNYAAVAYIITSVTLLLRCRLSTCPYPVKNPISLPVFFCTIAARGSGTAHPYLNGMAILLGNLDDGTHVRLESRPVLAAGLHEDHARAELDPFPIRQELQRDVVLGAR